MTMNFVPFAERCVEMVTEMYKTTAQHPTVINSRVLQNIIKVREIIRTGRVIRDFVHCMVTLHII